jgi:ribokinase
VLTGENTRDEKGIRGAGEKLLNLGTQMAIIKAGERGAYLATQGHFERIPGFNVKSVDTTAAGDSFNAGLAFALGMGYGIIEAIRFANAVAAISTTRDGAQPAMPLREEVEAFLANRVG